MQPCIDARIHSDGSERAAVPRAGHPHCSVTFEGAVHQITHAVFGLLSALSNSPVPGQRPLLHTPPGERVPAIMPLYVNLAQDAEQRFSLHVDLLSQVQRLTGMSVGVWVDLSAPQSKPLCIK